eukprot:jgi/Mesvir1/15594/Mv26140-RA.1
MATMAPPQQVMLTPPPAPQIPGPMDKVPQIDEVTAAALGGLQSITVYQKVSKLEAITMGCVEMANKYTIHPGHHDKAWEGPVIMNAIEKSDFWNRCCCAPYNNLFIEFRGGPTISEEQNRPPPVMTMEREACCTKCPCCFNWADCCLDGMTLHAGAVQGVPGKIVPQRVIGKAKQPKGCTFTPTVDVYDGGSDSALGVITGPFIFGGCSELCFSSPFKMSKPGTVKIGDMAIITKLKPKDCSGVLAEMFTDSDKYTIEFIDPSLTPQQKATILGSALLLDFMFFEMDNGMISCRNQALTITCFNCYCAGCLWPCQCTLSNNSGGS